MKINDISINPQPVTDIQKARKDIELWSTAFLYKQNLLMHSLKENIGIRVSRDQYDKWKSAVGEDTKGKYLHVYMGLMEESFKPIFYLIDSVSDANRNYDGNLFWTEMSRLRTIKPGTGEGQTPPDDEKEVLIATNSALRWLLFSNEWIESRQEKNVQLVRAFRMEFNSVDKVFESLEDNAHRVLLFFALYDYTEDINGEDVNYEEEINLRAMGLRKTQVDNYLGFTSNTFTNVTFPVPWPDEPIKEEDKEKLTLL